MKKHSKLAIFGAATLVASSFLIPQAVNATTNQTATIKASIAESLSLTLSANAINFNLESNDLYTDSIEVTGRTNSANGYTISFNANNDYNDLKHTNALIDSKIESIEGSAMESNFPNKSWGYSIDESDYLFKKIPLTPKNIFVTSGLGEQANDFTIGVKGGADLVAGDYENELLFTIVANPLTSNSAGGTEDGQDEPLIYDERGRAKAILGSNGNLNFVFNENTYTVGENYTDNKGETTIAAVYQVPINSGFIGWDPNVAWYSDKDQIYSVNIDESFYNFKPTSLTAWFKSIGNLKTFTNMQNLNTSEVTRMNSVFEYTGSSNGGDFNLDLSSWDTSKVRTMANMFYGSGAYADNFSLNLTNWDTSEVRNASNMFDNTAMEVKNVSLAGLSGWDMGKLENMFEMFYGAFRKAENLKVNLDNWDVSNVKNMRLVFYAYGEHMKGDSELSLNNWTARNAEEVDNFFGYTADYAENFTLNANNLYIGKATSLYQMMQDIGEHTTNKLVININNFSAPNATDASYMFYDTGYYNGGSVEANFKNWDLKNIETTNNMFYYFAATTRKLDFDISGWNTPKLKNMKSMFGQIAYSAPKFYMNVTGLDTENVKDMDRAFQQAGYNPNYDNVTEYYFEIKGLSSWDVSNVEDMSLLFQDAANKAKKIKLDIHDWEINAGNTTAMFQAFAQGASWVPVENLELNLSGWKIGESVNISNMFSSSSTCSYGVTCVLDLSDWDVSKVTNTSNMFYYVGHDAKNVSIDISGWDVRNITNMSNMFSCAGYNSENFSIDFTGWNIAPGTDITNMFNATGVASGYVAPF